MQTKPSYYFQIIIKGKFIIKYELNKFLAVMVVVKDLNCLKKYKISQKLFILSQQTSCTFGRKCYYPLLLRGRKKVFVKISVYLKYLNWIKESVLLRRIIKRKRIIIFIALAGALCVYTCFCVQIYGILLLLVLLLLLLPGTN